MTIEDDIAFFERVPTLNMLGRAALAHSRDRRREPLRAFAARCCSAPAMPADSGFVVQEGAFSLTAQQAEGGDSVVVGRGTLLGELALLTETVRPVTATAKEPSTVLRIPRTLFLKMLEGYPDAAAQAARHHRDRAPTSPPARSTACGRCSTAGGISR